MLWEDLNIWHTICFLQKALFLTRFSHCHRAHTSTSLHRFHGCQHLICSNQQPPQLVSVLRESREWFHWFHVEATILKKGFPADKWDNMKFDWTQIERLVYWMRLKAINTRSMNYMYVTSLKYNVSPGWYLSTVTLSLYVLLWWHNVVLQNNETVNYFHSILSQLF